LTLQERGTAIERLQTAAIRNAKPVFGWVMNSDKPNTLQTAYHILVASSPEILQKNEGDVWDSGRIESDNSVAAPYEGQPLKPSTVYYWKVKTFDNHGGESDFSTVKSFVTATELDGATARYPVQLTDTEPVNINRLDATTTFIDFGRDAWGRLKLTLTAESEHDTVTVHLGERITNGRLDRNPGGSIRYSRYRLALLPGTHTYVVKLRPDGRNTGNAAMKMPDYIGEVLPFRCCEIENYRGELKAVRLSAHTPFDDTAAAFTSSDTVLNKIWELSKYAIKMTSFTGTYIDGDRERIPYEREALISQLGQYYTDRGYAIARHSREYLLFHTTWPTEWYMQSVWMAWNEYLYTGSDVSLRRYYDDIRQKTLLLLRESNGLISTRTGKLTPEVKNAIHAKGEVRDIVDWPQSGGFGAQGEVDGFVFSDYNSVVNAYHYLTLCQMAKIAEALSKQADKDEFTRLAEQTKKEFNRVFYDAQKGCYRDGIDVEHYSLHADMFALSFGLVPEKHVKSVLEHIHSRGMACSISGALGLMEGLYRYNDADYAMQLLASTAERSWYNTIRLGATLTIEAWDNKYKPNLDWNQSAGALPAYFIPRFVMGVEPIEPGFRKLRIKPQPSTLRHAELKTPTIRGDVRVAFTQEPGKSFALEIEIPANTTAETLLPLLSGKYTLTVDDAPQKGVREGNFVKVMLGSGRHRIVISN
ncbi:MAG: alpha-L-rhamnosidase, partial [Tannerella sp.]|nr:alpha-L-rhamnosidase [Tannerella sp.]